MSSFAVMPIYIFSRVETRTEGVSTILYSHFSQVASCWEEETRASYCGKASWDGFPRGGSRRGRLTAILNKRRALWQSRRQADCRWIYGTSSPLEHVRLLWCTAIYIVAPQHRLLGNAPLLKRIPRILPGNVAHGIRWYADDDTLSGSGRFRTPVSYAAKLLDLLA